MSVLRPIEMTLINSLFGMNSGWVLDFSNPTFAEFFSQEVGVDIYDQAYERNGTSKGKRLKSFLQIGQKVAIVKALTALWEYREDSRVNRGETETVNNAQDRLSSVIQRLGGSPLLSHLAAATNNSVSPPVATGPTTLALAVLEENFSALHQMSEQAQVRGYAFEHFLKNWFDAWGLEARSSFRTTGEQIDGSFQHGGSTYLVEAKWQNVKTDATTLHGFQGKLLERPDWTRGLFVSYAGFSDLNRPGIAGGRFI